jgi:plastocyanin
MEVSMLRSFACAAALCFAAAPALAGPTVTVGHNRIEPARVEIAKGESVTFVNVDAMPGGHTVVADDGSFSSPPLAKDESFTHKFEQSGSVKIHLEQHPKATGEIVVK